MTPEEQALLFELWRRKQEQAEALRRSTARDLLASTRILSDDPNDPKPIPWEAWPALTDRLDAWEQGASEVILKDRQLGFSWAVAGFALHRAMRRGWRVAKLSKGQLEARSLLGKAKYLYDHLPEAERAPATWRADDVVFEGGGSITVYPSTEAAGIGETNQLIIPDEFAFHPYAASNYAAILPTISAGGQFIALSTADPNLGPSGFFHDLYWQAKRGENGYRAVFVGWWERPGRDAAWYEREKRKYSGNPEAFEAFYANSDEEAFKGKAGLVYPEFNPALHVVSASPMAWKAYRWRVAGVDPGGGDPCAIVPLGAWLPQGENWRCHEPGGYYDRTGQTTTDDILGYLGRLHSLAPFDFVVVDIAGGTTLLNTLVSHGLPAWPADKDRDGGITDVRALIKEGRWSIHAECKDQLAEFAGYRWRESVDPNGHVRYTTGTPVDHHADAHDARRYAVRGLTAALLAYAARQGRSEVALKVVGGTDRRTQAEIVRARIKARRKVRT